MHHSFNTFPALFFSVTLLAGSWTPGAVAGPVIESVTPPVWLQTQSQNTAAQPGTALTGQTLISTGRGGRAVVTMGQEQVEIDENSQWEWSGMDDGSAGNTIQGAMRVGTAQPKGQPLTESAAGDTAPRLYRKAPWMLVLAAGDDQVAAQRLVNFLNNSGYPVGAAQQVQLDSGLMWQIRLEGLTTSEAAMAIGGRLMALAPAIFSATPELKNTDTPTAPQAQEKVQEKIIEQAVEEKIPDEQAAEKRVSRPGEPRW